ncbi:DUF58 domain-containing protein, partial [Chloroflexota bacterium]
MEATLSTELMQKIRRMEIRTRHLVDELFAGEYLSIFKGRGIEFDEVRPYALGDDVRAVDWNVTARTGELHIKRYVEERELTLMLVVDASRSNDFGTVQKFKREAIAELAAILSFSATMNNDKVGLLIFTDRVELVIPPRKGRKHVLRLIRELLAFEPQGSGTDIKLGLDAINRLMKRRGIVFLVSDFLADPESYRQALTIASNRHDLIAVEVRDRLEQEFENVGMVVLEDAETGRSVHVDSSSRRWQQGFDDRVIQLESAKNTVFN